jgi:hypothetical protein
MLTSIFFIVLNTTLHSLSESIEKNEAALLTAVEALLRRGGFAGQADRPPNPFMEGGLPAYGGMATLGYYFSMV